ncbi:divalent-cation tolerance protein CutA [Shewanella sp. A3A]|uniref:Divalent-cation tolerance protein CutA n=1 Tax=Shewanella electrica TaxID=515560 RepID=A0ABT2FMR1_9GAMM|nr:divalent-cation tolerance protein CutA [Shewanella electrica]MCH1919972.1 divalent-cation tolerance protein CutA [Shewanella ferrihydritica]MCH1926088.1 divalent-cation tolerance protein CutA [Shewanella electrica]MCS4557543.1 divalent-cation tolerance protein CutA [Shewanella electrica]
MAHENAEALLVFCSFPERETAQTVADILVSEQLAACVQISAPMTSTYRWQGNICHDTEVAMQIKCQRNGYAELAQRIVALHPYDVPEILAVAVSDGLPAYLDWIKDNTK